MDIEVKPQTEESSTFGATLPRGKYCFPPSSCVMEAFASDPSKSQCAVCRRMVLTRVVASAHPDLEPAEAALLDLNKRVTGLELALDEGLKYDGDKPRYDLLDPYALEILAKVLGFGAEKYAEHNWRKGLQLTRLIRAGIGHLLAVLRGEDNDPETGLPHAGHAMCCCMFIIWTMKYRTDKDNRWRYDPVNEATAQMAEAATSTLEDTHHDETGRA